MFVLCSHLYTVEKHWSCTFLLLVVATTLPLGASVVREGVISSGTTLSPNFKRAQAESKKKKIFSPS